MWSARIAFAGLLLGGCSSDAKLPAGTLGFGGASGGTGGALGGAGGSVGIGATGGTGGTAAAFIDTDGVFARFNADGAPDTTFGTNGVVRVDLGPGAMVGNSTVRDAPWGIAKDGQDRLHMFAARKNTDGRTDTDRVVVRLTANGVVDTTFGTAGFHVLNVANLSDSARNGLVQTDGKIVTAGYTSQPTGVGTQAANAVIVARINGGDAPATGGSGGGGGGSGGGGGGGAGGAGGGAAPLPGTYDTTFGIGGLVNKNPFSSTDPAVMWGMAEAYGVARQPTTGAYVTTGYGRLAPSGQVNVVCFRFTPAGMFDTTWATNGVFERDLTTDNDRGRNIIALSDDRLLIAGSATPTSGNVDPMVMILTPNGALDTTFNTTGYKVYKLDAANDRTDEAFFGAALSPNGMFAAVAGYRNAPSPSTATVNNDAVLAILPLGGTGTEFVGVVPFSTTADDRAWAVTFDGNNKVVIAGFVTEGTDNYMAVARFNTDGTRDTTFGTGGIAKINAIAAGNLEEARGVIVQSTGKIVVGGTAER